MSDNKIEVFSPFPCDLTLADAVKRFGSIVSLSTENYVDQLLAAQTDNKHIANKLKITFELIAYEMPQHEHLKGEDDDGYERKTPCG